MKHSVDELVAIAHQFFPKGMPCSDPRYSETPEVQRQFAARIPASARYGDWRALLSRLVAASLLPRDSDEVPLGCSFGGVVAVEGVDGVG